MSARTRSAPWFAADRYDRYERECREHDEAGGLVLYGVNTRGDKLYRTGHGNGGWLVICAEVTE